MDKDTTVMVVRMKFGIKKREVLIWNGRFLLIVQVIQRFILNKYA